MVLEPLSTRSETVRDGAEKAKFRYGLDDPSLEKPVEADEPKKKRGPKVKGPNPLSVKKSKKKETASGPAKTLKEKSQKNPEDAPEKRDGDDTEAAKPKRRRRHHKSAAQDNDGEAAPSTETGPEASAMEVDE